MSGPPKAAEVRAARAFLFRKSADDPGLKSLSSRQFATAAKESGVGFEDLLQLLNQFKRGNSDEPR